MKTKDLLIIGAVGLGIYLMTRPKKKITYTIEDIMALSDADLQKLLTDLGIKTSQDKYTDPGVYSYWVVTEINKRKQTGVTLPVVSLPSLPKTNTQQSATNYGPSTGIVAPMTF